jgi:hypothetical protein
MAADMQYFRLSLPEGWENETVYLFRGPEDGGLQHYLRLVIHPNLGKRDLDTFAHDHIEQVKQNLGSIEVLREEPRTLESGQEVYEFVYKWIPADDKVIFQKFVYMAIEHKGYMFSCEFNNRTRKTVALEVEKIIESFEPLELA